VHQATVRVPNGSTHGWRYRILLRGDAHHDNPHTDHDLERKHLDECLANGWAWMDVGDLFCAMGGKYDPRSCKRDTIRPEHAVAKDYLDSLVRHAADFYRPYVGSCIVIGKGNHETGIEKRHETCLNTRLCERLDAPHLSGGYGGWVHLVLERYGGQRNAIKIKYFHGSGGGGIMSMDTLRTRRIASWVPDADVVVCGHVHEQWWAKVNRERLRTEKGRYCVDEYADGFDGFHVERGGPPKPVGAIWMNITARNNRDGKPKLLGVSFEEAS
jgi:hypothetical protein